MDRAEIDGGDFMGKFLIGLVRFVLFFWISAFTILVTHSFYLIPVTSREILWMSLWTTLILAICNKFFNFIIPDELLGQKNKKNKIGFCEVPSTRREFAFCLKKIIEKFNKNSKGDKS